MEKKDNWTWLKNHADAIIILGTFAVCFWTINEKMNEQFNTVRNDIASVKTDLAVVKTVLIMKNILPQELCKIDPKETEKK